MADSEAPRPRRRWRPSFGTVRARVTAIATVVVASVLVVTAVVLVVVQRRTLVDGLDTNVRQRADDIESAIAGGSVPPTLGGRGDEALAQVADVDGRIVAASANVAGAGPIAPPPDRREEIRTLHGLPVDDDAFRVLSRRVLTAEGPYTIHVAKSADDVDESVDALTRGLSLAVPAVTLLLGALVWWLTGRVLRPVESIRREVASMRGTDLGHRVPEPASDDEIARLARTMNAMLERIEVASERQRQFVDDASHELRTPLTRIRSRLEVAASEALDPDEARRTMRDLLRDVEHVQYLVDDLLLLARMDAVTGPASPALVDLDDLVFEDVARLRTLGRVRIDTSRVTGAQVVGNRPELARVVRNLADNALRHARTTVSFALHESGGDAVLTVTNDGSPIPPEHRDTVFEPFTRLDEARTADGGGSGLGLAIVERIVTAHGGTVAVDPAYVDGARFVVRLPAANGSAPA